LASAFKIHPVLLYAYFDGHLSRDQLNIGGDTSLDACLKYHGDRWEETIVEVARRLPLDLSPEGWARQLDLMVVAEKHAKGVWDPIRELSGGFWV